MIKIYNAENEMEAQYLCSLLRDAGIVSYLQESGAGEYLKITSGINIYGTDLFVNEKDVPKAKEIMQGFIQEKNQNQRDDTVIKIPWYKNRTILARIILGWAVFCGFMVAVLSL